MSQPLQDRLKVLGFSTFEQDGVLYLKAKPLANKQHQVKAQSCETAVVALRYVKGLPKPDRQLLQDLELKVWSRGFLTGNQLVMLQRPVDGLVARYASQLVTMGFDLEQLYDQVPPPGADTDGDQVVVAVDSIEIETAKAWLLQIGGSNQWFPKSQCTLSTDPAGKKALLAPRWLLRAKGVVVPVMA